MMKQIQVRCHEPIAIDPTWKQGWSDVWLRWKWNPKRSCRAFLTLVGRIELLSDMETTKRCLDDSSDLWYHFRCELDEQERMLASLSRNEMVYNTGSLTVYTRNDWINRAEAERMISLYLTTENIWYPKFVWKRPTHIISPVTILPKGITDGDSFAPISGASSDCP